MNSQLIPKAPRRKRQPSAQAMREQLAAAADRIIELEAEAQALRLANEKAAAVIWEGSLGHRILRRLKRWVRL